MSKGSKSLKGEKSGLLDSSTPNQVRGRPFRPLDPKITAFLKKHHVLTLATSNENIPWVAHCFYAFLEREMWLVFTTDDATRHGEEMIENSVVSVGIAWETKIVGQIRGAQISGRVRRVQKVERSKGSKSLKVAYLKRFPYAALMKTNLWVLEIKSIKYTDNRLGFGKKLVWERRVK